MSTSLATSPEALPTTETTVHDLRLAELLGYRRPVDIRKLIKRHLPMLEAMGGLRHGGVNPGRAGGRPTEEYHLNRAQTAFIIAKADTRMAESLTVKMAEVFALFSDGRLVAADTTTAKELSAIAERERARRLLIHAEEKAGRDTAFAVLKRR